MWHIEFLSANFLPTLPEECQNNPGAYGFELALWLAQQLAKQGIVTSYPLGEDWGWFIEYIDGDAEFIIGCGSQSEEHDGYKGTPINWYIFIEQQRSLKQRLKGLVAPEIAAKLEHAVLAALRLEDIEPHTEPMA